VAVVEKERAVSPVKMLIGKIKMTGLTNKEADCMIKDRMLTLMSRIG